ncbi:MAG: hypothetical protein KDK55_06190 [Chlamydiia bacterium]|nr:hypothetical protein [Chlamydiia bacterium]
MFCGLFYFQRTFSPRCIFCKLLLLFVITGSLQADEIFDAYPPHIKREIEYRYPTERFINAYGWETISSGLKNLNVSMIHRNLFDKIWHREEPGFLGYHGSTQEYRIYQDIIRLILEEQVQIPIREDFHFLRIPGDPQFHHQTLQEYGSDYGFNYSPTHFLCMNYALYGNFQHSASCSYYYFANNTSLNYVNYENKLVWLFNTLGIDTSSIHEAFTIGRYHLSAEKGILIQVFDMSHFNPWKEYYELSDEQCGGFSHSPISEIIKGTDPSSFFWQIRMLMSNRHTLNPHSSLYIKRYDALDSQIIQKYEQELREFIKGLDVDKEKVIQYRQELFTVWEVSDEQAE